MENKDNLIRIYNSTCNDIKRGYYVNRNGEDIEFQKVGSLKKNSIIYTGLDQIPEDKRPNFPNTKIYAENIDTFEKAIEFGSKAACLNMASNWNPGGGVHNGSRAQEECLCRRSNLLLSLYSFDHRKKNIFGFLRQGESYPLQTFGGIYSPCVNIYKTKDYTEYTGDPNITNVISVSAVNKPKLDENGQITKSYIPMVKGKIRTILRIAINHGHSKLVLGAFGCGAYGNPARQTAELFKAVLEEPEFNHSFEEICFAVLDDHNAKRVDNKEGNFKPFVDVFGKK